MDNAFRKILAKALEQIESGTDAERVLASFPEHANALSGHLGLWEQLAAAERVQPEAQAIARGQRAMLSALAANTGGTRQMFNTPNLALAKAAAVVAGIILFAGGAAGVSAALGGPDLAGSPLRAVGVGQNHDSDDGQAGQHEDGCVTTGSPTPEPTPSPTPVASDEENDQESQCENVDCAAGATPAADTPTPAPGTSPDDEQDEHQCGDNAESTEGQDGPNENANPNASEGCANRLDGRNNASDDAANGDANANPRAFEGGNGNGGTCDASTGQGSGDVSPNGQGNGNANGDDKPNPTPHSGGNGKPDATPKGTKN